MAEAKEKKKKKFYKIALKRQHAEHTKAHPTPNLDEPNSHAHMKKKSQKEERGKPRSILAAPADRETRDQTKAEKWEGGGERKGTKQKSNKRKSADAHLQL